MDHRFDPQFDDCAWTDAWTKIPVAQLIPGQYATFRVTSWQMAEADICGRQVTLSPPLEVRGLITADGTLWMSDVPQERLMMLNNARQSRGRILVGGMGVGLYPQYAMPNAAHMVIVERDAVVAEVVSPLVRVAAAAYGVPVDVTVSGIEDVLEAEPASRFDTIFLDTWDTLDAAILPEVNRLRNLALNHLAEDGRILLWGYRWMVRLFEDACRQILQVAPGGREDWLREASRHRPEILPLLEPVLVEFSGSDVKDMDAALAWCRDMIMTRT